MNNVKDKIFIHELRSLADLLAETVRIPPMDDSRRRYVGVLAGKIATLVRDHQAGGDSSSA